MQGVSVSRAGVLLALCVAVAGCEREAPQLIHPQRGQVTPDEFSILPGKPIEMPKDFAALPAPTPGQPNRTDATPRADAVAALGGNPARIERDGKTGADGALITQASRYGVDPQVREKLAAADLEYRKKHRGRLLERLLNVTTYYNVYERDELNQHGTTERFRQAGRGTSAPPPDPETD
ncbi:MAG: DUF3035 domain-containing protein [Tropicimonas sp.]|uniref:DUF3035 domain-containing protein n=1 Tax=Tropicimonas sp. TaxID=2067044 RepID=UPI003A899CC9